MKYPSTSAILSMCVIGFGTLVGLRLRQMERRLSALEAPVRSVPAVRDGAETLFDLKDYPGAAIGSRDTGSVVVLFSDYLCPHCQEFADRDFGAFVKAARDGKFRLEVRTLPLRGPVSVAAAMVAICASENGTFLAVHASLFDQALVTAEERRDTSISALASLLNERTGHAAQDGCLTSATTAAIIQNGTMTVRRMGIPGTPTLLVGRRRSDGVIDGVMLPGRPSLEYVEEILRR